MSLAPSGLLAPQKEARIGAARRAGPIWTAAILVIVAVGVGMRALFHTDPDVSWLLYAAQRVIDGAVPYKDVWEVNPPASIYLYVPPVLIGRLFGLRPETVTVGYVMAIVAVSLALTFRILARAKSYDPARLPVLFGASLAVLLILPLGSFGQREHLVVAALLPALATLAIRQKAMAPSAGQVFVAGLGLAAAVIIKPVFALAVLGPLLDLGRVRGLRPALAAPEAWLAALLSLAYTALVAVLAPDFAARVLPLVIDIYLPARTSLPLLLVLPTVPVLGLMLTSFCLAGGPTEPFGRNLAQAAVGLGLAYLIQGKGFPYHGLPAVLTATLACFAAAILPGRPIRESWPRFVPAAIGLVMAGHLFIPRFDFARFAPGLPDAVAAITPSPRLLTIGGDMPMGRALARRLGGEWVGAEPIAWVTLFASVIEPEPETDPRFAAAIRAEQGRFAQDIANQRPDVLVIEGDDWLGWVKRSPPLAAALTAYQPVGRFGRVLLYRSATPGTALRPTLSDPPQDQGVSRP